MGNIKILYVTTISNTVNAFLIPHIRYLIEQGHKVDIACNIIQEMDPAILELECEIYNISFQRSPLRMNNLKSFKKLKSVIEKGDYQLVHTHTPVASVVARLACMNIKGVTLLYTAHGFHFYKKSPLKNWVFYYTIEKILARWTDGILTMNDEDYAISKKMKLRRPELNHKINGVGVNLDYFKPQTESLKIDLRRKYGYKENDFILIYAAELSYRKNQELLLYVVSLLKKEIPNIKLLLAGTGGMLDRYKEKINELNINKNVELLGYRKDVAKLLNISDIAVSSSRQEGLPVNLLEAMSTGLPLVVTDCRGNRDLVSNNENGYVVNINDVEGLAHVIEKLYNSKATISDFSRKNIELVQKYSIENIIKQLDWIYNKISKKGTDYEEKDTTFTL